MKTKALNFLFMLISTFGFSQISIPKFTPTLNQTDLNETDILDEENDSVDILTIRSTVFDSLIRDKIKYANSSYKTMKNFKNFMIFFYSFQFYDYIVISSNNPDSQIQKEKDLVGIVFIDDTRVFIHNQSKISMEYFFDKSQKKYKLPKYKYEDMIYDGSTFWKYIYINGILIHVCDD